MLLRSTNAGLDFRDENPYQKAIREVAGQVQILIYRRTTTPIRDWDEVLLDLNLRIAEISKDNGSMRQKRMVELAAYALYAAVVDSQNGHDL